MKKAAAETEDAWIGAGEKIGTEIWRIEKFKVGECDDVGTWAWGRELTQCWYAVLAKTGLAQALGFFSSSS